MTQDDENADDTLGQLYDLLAGVLADPPDEETVRTLTEGSLPAPEIAPNDRLAAGLQALASWSAGVEDPAAEAERLAAEFTRLFVGPRPVINVHESGYRGDYLGEPLAVVKDTYTDLGIAPAPDLKEEADHAAVELAVLRELSANGEDRKSDFLAAHGDWFDALADDVREAAEEPFYEAIADLVGGLIAFDAEREGIER